MLEGSITGSEAILARKWVKDQLRRGTRVAYLHDLIDQAAANLLGELRDAERRERHRADALHVERDQLQAEVDRLREGVAALNQKGRPDA